MTLVNALAFDDVAAADPRPARVPPAIANRFDLLTRGWRPALGWAGVAVVSVGGLAIMLGLAAVIWRAAITGEPIPDLSAGLTPLVAVLAPILGAQVSRCLEILKGRA